MQRSSRHPQHPHTLAQVQSTKLSSDRASLADYALTHRLNSAKVNLIKTPHVEEFVGSPAMNVTPDTLPLFVGSR
eukprot:m.198470 g.198470  ORF g.198470 m.198470 type:complete len:75 (-) comp25136_c1_seq1:18-242(-)